MRSNILEEVTTARTDGTSRRSTISERVTTARMGAMSNASNSSREHLPGGARSSRCPFGPAGLY